jgi:tryptophan-rich sensory protein
MNTREWYESLTKPSWAPQPDVFGKVWSVIYPIIFGVNILIIVLLTSGKISWIVALPFWINLLLNFAYTPIQFGLRNQFLSSIVILLVFFTIIWCMVAIFPYSKWITVAYIPYLAWVGIASVLQINLWWLNR